MSMDVLKPNLLHYLTRCHQNSQKRRAIYMDFGWRWDVLRDESA